MKTKVIISSLIILVVLGTGVYLKMNNECCKKGNRFYVDCGGKPMDITHLIEKENYKCLNESLVINPNPREFTQEQMVEIRSVIPDWIENNLKDSQDLDRDRLKEELNALSDVELQNRMRYQYSFFENLTSEEVFVYSFKIPNQSTGYMYCVNYQNVYDVYDRPSNEVDGYDLYPVDKKPKYSIVESKEWAANFGIDKN